MSQEEKIIYTLTDEAPMLATQSWLPIVKAFSKAAGVDVEIRDISLAGRILAAFPEQLGPEKQVSDALAELGSMVSRPDANIIKLPNISASVPQIQAAVKELQSRGFNIPDFPEEPRTDEEKRIRARYETVKGSAVNPVLRMGNSDRRSAPAVKAHAKKHPHSMGTWSPDSATHVSSMSRGDFFGSEKSVVIPRPMNFRIEFVSPDGSVRELRKASPLEEGEVLDAAVMSMKELDAFLKTQIADAKEKNVLFSVHLKATMMKISDPIIFGRAVLAYFSTVFTRNAETFAALGVAPDHGLGDLEKKLLSLPGREASEIRSQIRQCMEDGPDLAMVDSNEGITNLHVPSDIIIDASMPAAIRIGGHMWDKDGGKRDMKAIIPDRSYAGIYQAAINFCKEHGAFNPAEMGSVSNAGLMARKAEEYGSHDKTFTAPGNGVIRAVDNLDDVLLEQPVESGDLFRMCQTKDDAIQDWVGLAVRRARSTGSPAVFWLDENRTHDARLIEKVRACLPEHDTAGLDISILPPEQACLHALERCRTNQDTISVTGNVLRDYLTDLFPILELGTSAKMLSIVPLMAGGGLFETGAGGSAPKHVRQLTEENHLRWDSLGEFLALAVSYEHLAETFGNKAAGLLGKTLDAATARLLEENKSPSRSCGELDNRGSHFYLALYWAEELAAQNEDVPLKEHFAPAAQALSRSEAEIVEELNAVQGRPVDLGGYYHPDKTKMAAAMRPCSRFNSIIDNL